MRLDVFLFQNKYVKSRQKAKVLIEDGNVKLDGKVIFKSSYDVKEDEEHIVEIVDNCPYVSRGGLKLEKLLKEAKIDVNEKICVDIGASTGGFTHCLLTKGAKCVYAIDSGTNQLSQVLRSDMRVISIENFNARNITVDNIGRLVDVVTMDVSFISQTLILPAVSKLLNKNGVFLSLIKPQFEVGKANIDKGGIVKKATSRFQAIKSVISCANEQDLNCVAITQSPILGGDGNIEYLAAFSKNGVEINEDLIKKLVFDKQGE